MSPFRPGVRVLFKNRSGGGIVRSATGDRVTVELDEGIELTVQARELVVCEAGEEAHLHNWGHPEQIRKVKKDVQESPVQSPYSGPEIPVIDLHFEKITGREPEPGEQTLMRQLSYLKKCLSKLKAAGCREVIVIHGVGQGILRNEVNALLRQYPDIRLEQIDSGRFGGGAVKVTFIQE